VSRSLSSRLGTEIVKTVTAPFFLVRVVFPGYAPLYLSTGPTVTYDYDSVAQQWVSGSASLSALRSLPGGGLEASVSLSNTDDAVAALALTQDPGTVSVRLWMLYGAPPFSAGDAEQVFTGVVDSMEIRPTRVTLSCVSESRRRLYGPRLTVSPPLCNFLPPGGTWVLWGGEMYELKGAD
jgi:hypothetical protein